MPIWNSPSKDGYTPHVHTTACRCGMSDTVDSEHRSEQSIGQPLPPDHGWTRNCPRCGTPLFKKHYYDLWRCGCGWTDA